MIECKSNSVIKFKSENVKIKNDSMADINA